MVVEIRPQQYLRGGLPVSHEQENVIRNLLAQTLTVVGAGAGTGKTYTTVAAVMELIEQGEANLDEFVLITFTNNGARELRDRILKALKTRFEESEDKQFWGAQIERISAAFIGTIHAFCLKLLRSFGYGVGTAREASLSFSVRREKEAIADAVDGAANETLALLLSEETGWLEYDLTGAVKKILDDLRNQGYSILKMLDETYQQADDEGKPYRIALAELVKAAYERYQSLKQSEHVLDASDLLAFTADLLQGTHGDHVANLVKKRHRYLFVDEFQDTDLTQKIIIEALLPVMEKVMVVGDRKQAIYEFRKTNSKLLDKMAEDHGVELLPLTISRRSTKPLLEANNILFYSMQHRYPALNQPLNPSEDAIIPSSKLPPMTYLALKGNLYELTAQTLLRLLQNQIDDPDDHSLRDVKPGDIAILGRTNAQLMCYEAALKPILEPHGIQIRRETGGQFYQRPEIVATYRMLRLVLRFPDDLTLSLALRTPYLRDIDGSSEEAYLLQYGAKEGSPLTDWFETTEAYQKILEIRNASRADTVPQLLVRLYDAFEIREYFDGIGEHRATENLERLRELARRLVKQEQALTLRQYVRFLEMTILSSQEESEGEPLPGDDKRPDYIRLMTIHAAKGLEFPLVVIPEMQKPLLQKDTEPWYLVSDGFGLDAQIGERIDTRSEHFVEQLKRDQGDRLAEEMRLLYVAITRAQSAVLLLGKGNLSTIYQPGSPWYSWKDEVLSARKGLVEKGAKFGEIGRV